MPAMLAVAPVAPMTGSTMAAVQAALPATPSSPTGPVPTRCRGARLIWAERMRNGHLHESCVTDIAKPPNFGQRYNVAAGKR